MSAFKSAFLLESNEVKAMSCIEGSERSAERFPNCAEAQTTYEIVKKIFLKSFKGQGQFHFQLFFIFLAIDRNVERFCERHRLFGKGVEIGSNERYCSCPTRVRTVLF